MATKETLRNFVKNLLAEQGMTSDFSDDASLNLTGILDSISVLQILVFMEQEFGFDFSDQDFDQTDFDSIDSMMELIERSSPSPSAANSAPG